MENFKCFAVLRTPSSGDINWTCTGDTLFDCLTLLQCALENGFDCVQVSIREV